MRTFSTQTCSACGAQICLDHIRWSPERNRWEDRRCKKRLDDKATRAAEIAKAKEAA